MFSEALPLPRHVCVVSRWIELLAPKGDVGVYITVCPFLLVQVYLDLSIFQAQICMQYSRIGSLQEVLNNHQEVFNQSQRAP